VVIVKGSSARIAAKAQARWSLGIAGAESVGWKDSVKAKGSWSAFGG